MNLASITCIIFFTSPTVDPMGTSIATLSPSCTPNINMLGALRGLHSELMDIKF